MKGKSRKERDLVLLAQWVEITMDDGKTLTELFPSNDVLIEKMLNMEPGPDLVYRRLNFRGGIPPEYMWLNGAEKRREVGGLGIQRMTLREWLKVIELEKFRQHLLPVNDPLPRPMSRGGCNCEDCEVNRARLQKQGRVEL